MRQILFLFGLMTVLVGGLLLLARRSESRAYWLTYDSATPVVIHRRLPDGSIHNMRIEAAHNIELWDWSPDGRWLIYSDDSQQIRDLFRVHVSGAPVEQLTDLPGVVVNAVYSPDGAWIVFAVGERLEWALYRIPAEGGEAQPLTELAFLPQRATWSPDGAWIAFADMDDEDRWSVYTMRPDGSDLLRVYVSTVQANLNAPQRPVWSPDGEWIVFSNVLPNLEANIHRVRSDGSELQALTEGESLNLLPFFAQGGLYFSSDRNGEFNIYRLNLNDDAPPQAITSSPDDMFLMNVSPDGAWLHILREEFSSGSGPFGDYRLISTDGSRSQRIRAATSPEFRPTTWSPLIDMPLRAEMLVAGGMVMVGLAVMGRRRKRIRM